jgi:hypothetical protein
VKTRDRLYIYKGVLVIGVDSLECDLIVKGHKS